MSFTNQKFYAIAKVYGYEIETRLHDHISSAVDEAFEKITSLLKQEGIKGKKINAVIEVFAKDEKVSNLIESIKTRISI
ncbi:hypothetical protein BFU36_02715 [Sulfolobus sp. A20]|uniref:hypothetical protein n=1 Tax=Saccharolobus sp. A20 TaxID=1891280 RepID=UPI000846126C|nr:hypothetical protein [Sulfolobus sp. A20]TRM73295.1 hypothetical protein DJ523_07685 [Sulfolobus sp. E5]TRM75648.1 hypothetical protein DJ532_09670 [Sulfolobus sp. A20-N-F8]TRM79173.1 hypothetical protein DJ528_02495 [Sulfolobus sp. B5]TRM80257.1 hypothetical protein DJ524_08230 [Sulfolobus sp. D5]TRM85881.1 hypothetical protein DJ521_06880 [Sulfolobus sp. E3]TRM89249.1 hypothetical protein DJ529_02700 [Sulfolobus sp. C3]TRM97761.1 hypothetical protein DJ530_11865 [Sulfolobus sp. E1]TRN0